MLVRAEALRRIGGIEKNVATGHIDYAPANHQAMTDIRARKVQGVADSYAPQKLEQGEAGAALCVAKRTASPSRTSLTCSGSAATIW